MTRPGWRAVPHHPADGRGHAAERDGGLRAFRDPASVAVVGASADPAKWGYWIARGALRGSGRRGVYLVNRNGADIDGVPSVPRLRDLAQPPELAVLCVPAAAVPAVVEEGLDLGVRAFLGITAGLDAAGGRGTPPASEPAAGETPGLERRLADRIRAAGARLLGPNCLGVFDAGTALELAWGEFTPGPLGIVSQSGQLGLELAGLAAHAGIGVSRFVSVGNQADVTADEVLADMVGHQATRVVAVYLESFRDGRSLVHTLRRLRRAGKPVALLTVGASEAGRGAARSHTGALTSPLEVVDAACRAAGCVPVDTPAQLVDLAQFLLEAPRPRGRRVVVLGDSGGQGAVAADLLTRYGLEVPPLPGRLADRVAAALPAWAAAGNPVDLAGRGEQDLTTYARLTETVLDSGEADAVLLTGYFGAYGANTPSLEGPELGVVDRIAAAASSHRLPVVVHSMCPDSVAVRALRRRGVPTYHTVDAAGRALGAATELALRPGRAPVPQADDPPPPGRPRSVPYWAARTLLAGAGVPFPAGAEVSDATGARAAASRLRRPYALKAGWLDHKTDAGGMLLDLPDPDAVADGYRRLARRLGQAGGYVLEEMDTRPGVVEVLVGGRHDPSFGPLVMVGLGGTAAELLRDTALELAPVGPEQARAMLARLRLGPLLTGWRGRPAVDVAAVAEAVAAVSRLVAAGGIVECEINPLRAGPDGVVAVDALVAEPDGAVPPRRSTRPPGAP